MSKPKLRVYGYNTKNWCIMCGGNVQDKDESLCNDCNKDVEAETATRRSINYD